jgi:predicted lipoprotein with Yx(FWY)xxD motif
MMLAGTVLALGAVATACGGSSSGGAASASPSQPAAGASTSSAPAASASSAVDAKKISFGTILVDDKGKTLYLFKPDKGGGKSTCYSTCAVDWPPLLTNGKATPGSGLKASLLGTTTRSDGKTQVTYHGWPLYYYAGDSAPGDMNGQDIDSDGGGWYVIGATTGEKLEK